MGASKPQRCWDTQALSGGRLRDALRSQTHTLSRAGIPIMIANFVGFENNISLKAQLGLSWCWSSHFSDGDPVSLHTVRFCGPV